MTPNRPKIAVITFLGSLDDHDAAWALAELQQISHDLLANPLIESYEIELLEEA